MRTALLSVCPKGYDTEISDSDGSLSQGQRQLLCIARVMLMDPPCSFSTGDQQHRHAHRAAHPEGLRQDDGGQNEALLSPTASPPSRADVILVMRDGNIVEQGNHETLLTQGGFYANLYNSQFAVED